MKLRYFLILSVLAHLVPFLFIQVWQKDNLIEIIEAEFIGSAASTAKTDPKAINQKTYSPSVRPAISQAKNTSNIVNSQIISETNSQTSTSEGSGSNASAPPKILKEIFAPYPKEARRAHIEGDVVLKVLIGEDGKVEEASVIDSLGYGLDEAALVAIRQFIFSPGFKDGKIVKVQIKYRYKFRLD